MPVNFRHVCFALLSVVVLAGCAQSPPPKSPLADSVIALEISSLVVPSAPGAGATPTESHHLVDGVVVLKAGRGLLRLPTLSTAPNSIELPEVTVQLADLSRFHPRGAKVVELPRWSSPGVPSIVRIKVPVEIHYGDLAGLKAHVRFTPKTFRWIVGNGVTSFGGSPRSFREQGGDATTYEGDATLIFSRPGIHRLVLEVSYGVEYRFVTGSWHEVHGLMHSESDRMLEIGHANSTAIEDAVCTSPAETGEC